MIIAYKLMRRRKDGTLGPLFINRVQRVPMNKWLAAEDHKTKGYKHRPGWHCTLIPVAPHLKLMEDRVWCEVHVRGVTRLTRPTSQGGEWLLAGGMKVVHIMSESEVEAIIQRITP